MDVSPDPIFEIASGFMGAKLLFVANEVGLFAALAGNGAGIAGGAGVTLDELAARIGVAPRRLRVVADAMVALGLVEHAGGR